MARHHTMDYKREAVWQYLGKRVIDNFDIHGDWAILYNFQGKELATRVYVPDAIKRMEKKNKRKK